MYHSIKFDNAYDCYDHWHLIPAKRPHVSPPSVKNKTIEIPGGNGIIDLTDSLTGYPLFNNREGSFEFYVENGYEKWFTLYNNLLDYFHGSIHIFNLEDEPDYYYKGRITIENWDTGDFMSTVTMNYSVDPFKYFYKNAVEQFSNFKDYPLEIDIDGKNFGTRFFEYLPKMVNKYPVIPVIKVDSINSNEPLGTVQFEFYNKELNIDISSMVVADVAQRLPMCPLSNLSGNNEMWFKIGGPSKASLNFRNVVL